MFTHPIPIKHSTVIALIIFSALLTVALPAHRAFGQQQFTLSDHDDHADINGHMSITYDTTSCASVIHLCASGSVTGKYLNGIISGQLDSLRQNSHETVFTGVATIHTKKGDLSGILNIVQPKPGDVIHGTLTFTSGTKAFQKTRGPIRIYEPTAATGSVQSYLYSGYLNHVPDQNDD